MPCGVTRSLLNDICQESNDVDLSSFVLTFCDYVGSISFAAFSQFYQDINLLDSLLLILFISFFMSLDLRA